MGRNFLAQGALNAIKIYKNIEVHGSKNTASNRIGGFFSKTVITAIVSTNPKTIIAKTVSRGRARIVCSSGILPK
jgi:hypothetical protein